MADFLGFEYEPRSGGDLDIGTNQKPTGTEIGASKNTEIGAEIGNARLLNDKLLEIYDLLKNNPKDPKLLQEKNELITGLQRAISSSSLSQQKPIIKTPKPEIPTNQIKTPPFVESTVKKPVKVAPRAEIPSKPETPQPEIPPSPKANLITLAKSVSQINPDYQKDIGRDIGKINRLLQQKGLPEKTLGSLIIDFSPIVKSTSEQINRAQKESEAEIPLNGQKRGDFAEEVLERQISLPQSAQTKFSTETIGQMYGLDFQPREVKTEIPISQEQQLESTRAETATIDTSEEELGFLNQAIARTGEEISNIEDDLGEIKTTNEDLRNQLENQKEKAYEEQNKIETNLRQFPSSQSSQEQSPEAPEQEKIAA